MINTILEPASIQNLLGHSFTEGSYSAAVFSDHVWEVGGICLEQCYSLTPYAEVPVLSVELMMQCINRLFA